MDEEEVPITKQKQCNITKFFGSGSSSKKAKIKASTAATSPSKTDGYVDGFVDGYDACH